MQFKLLIILFSGLFCLQIAAQETALPENISAEPSHTLRVPTLDLTDAEWGEGNEFKLDGLWHAYWGYFLNPAELADTEIEPFLFPVPGVWSDQPRKKNRYTTNTFSPGQTDFVDSEVVNTVSINTASINSTQDRVLPALGYMTYHAKVRLPERLGDVFLYVPDMPSAYKLFVNGELVASNGQTGYFQNTEKPGFLPKVVRLSHQGELDLVIQLSNFHYREGGIWFSLRLTDESGYFSMAQQPIISAVFFAAILIAIGLFNFSFFAFRSKEVAALYFGLLCLVVGVRRLLIDERVIYLFDWFDWATLQRIEHLCFYLSLPLFMGFFTALYRKHIPQNIPRLSWILISPFVLICLLFSNRIYTELNLAFQVLVLISVSYALVMYIQVVRAKGAHIKVFGISLLILMLAVIHDVLKANGLVGSNVNIAHFGVLAFVIAQSIALQRIYLKSLDLVEAMSRQLKIRNKELVEMDAFKDEFLATTSHELRTPLQGIAGLAKVLQEDAGEQFSDEQKSKISLIAKTTQRLSVLVNDILDFSAIKHGKLKLNPGSVDLKALAELTLSTVSPLLRNKDIKLSASIAEDARFMQADEFRFQQILINLMGNAVKYTEKGFIELASYTTSEHIVIEISDSGVGIPLEKRQSLFRPFEQIHVEGHITASGTGLGLSISKQLVELHGGTLDISSQVGKGTTVTLNFPLSLVLSADKSGLVDQATETLLRPEPASAGEPSQDSSQQGHHTEAAERFTHAQSYLLSQHSGTDQPAGPLIYIVDDEAVNRELLASMLVKQGYLVEQFAEGISALTRITQRVPDLILLDFMMPRMSGLEVCQCIRKQYDSYELPVMMLTARHMIQDIVAALGAGANDYLIKPYHDQELIARVKSQLSVRQYWIANRENQKLKNEIKRRETLEDELSEMNMRLLSVLDISAEMILLINDKLQIVYANEQANNLLQTRDKHQDNKSLLGKPIHDFIDNRLFRLLSQALNGEDNKLIQTETRDEQAGLIWHASIKRFHQDESCYLALMMQSRSLADAVNPNDALNQLTHELSESRQKIHDIESTLRLVLGKNETDEPLDNAEDIESLLAERLKPAQNPSLPEPAATATDTTSAEQVDNPKDAIVSLLRQSLNFWERYTNKGKVELAEQSRCWRVYVDGTTVKTRTFDKYLSARSIPARPRWRAVVRTANFVLANCPLNEQEAKLLKQLCTAVENHFS
jgi:signal transduction histidine kinase/DNA-binding response OmpR family regulator